jgi:nucleoside-diphosphate-sugar epimerase
MRVFLTGASGYLGGVLSEHLVQLPAVEEITGIGLTRPKNEFPGKMKFSRMDIRSPELTAVMAGHDVVVHTACVVLWPAKMPVSERDDINLNGVRNVAQSALANGVKHFVHASSMAVYDPALARGKSDVAEDFPLGKGDSPFYYWNAKATAERTLMEVLGHSGMQLTMFRPIYIIGPRNQATIANYHKNAVNFPGLNPRRQFIHEDDVAAAFVHAMVHCLPGTFNVVPDDCLRMSDVWKILGLEHVRTVPLGVARLVTWLRWRLLGSAIHPSWVQDTLLDFTGSNSKLKETGWRPRFNSAEALRSALC